MTKKQTIEDFVSQESIAVVGVSRNQKKFGNVIFKELSSRHYDVYPVNPHLDTFEGKTCYSSLKELPADIGGAVLAITPEQAEKVVKDAKEAGITRIWFQQGCKSNEAVCFCNENGISEVHGECILMYAKPVASIHKFHRWIWKLFGKLPK